MVVIKLKVFNFSGALINSKRASVCLALRFLTWVKKVTLGLRNLSRVKRGQPGTYKNFGGQEGSTWNTEKNLRVKKG